MKSERLNSPVRWFGGKGNMIAKLLPLVPPGGRPYCEPYCGGASLFFAREPAPVEVLNDLNNDLVNLFRVLQDRQQFEELRHRLMWTLYARAEFGRALDILANPDATPLERAWAFFVRQNQGFGGKMCTNIGDWGRVTTSVYGMAKTTSAWLGRLCMLDAYHWRLARAQVDNRDAIEVIRYWDNPDAVFYLDPPYVLYTRKDKSVYVYEPADEHHKKLVEVLLSVRGAAVLSGYDNPIYWPLESAGWRRHEFPTACHAAGRVRGSKLRGDGNALKHAARTEIVWVNPKAASYSTARLCSDRE